MATRRCHGWVLELDLMGLAGIGNSTSPRPTMKSNRREVDTRLFFSVGSTDPITKIAVLCSHRQCDVVPSPLQHLRPPPPPSPPPFFRLPSPERPDPPRLQARCEYRAEDPKPECGEVTMWVVHAHASRSPKPSTATSSSSLAYVSLVKASGRTSGILP